VRGIELVQATADALVEMDELLPLLHDMEGVTSGSTIAPLAEAVLEGVARAGSQLAAGVVAQLRLASASRRRELAAKKRQETLAALGMQQVRLAVKWYISHCVPS
jgi:E3 ubiquitin-protein ligase UBR4